MRSRDPYGVDRDETRCRSCMTGASFFSQRTVGVGLPDTRHSSSAVCPREVVMLFMGASSRMKKGPGRDGRREEHEEWTEHKNLKSCKICKKSEEKQEVKPREDFIPAKKKDIKSSDTTSTSELDLKNMQKHQNVSAFFKHVFKTRFCELLCGCHCSHT